MLNGAKELRRINDVYSNHQIYPGLRANSQLGGGKKSVSIVSLSPSDGMQYGKDIMIYNPYSKSMNKQTKIHLPYLKKNRRAMPRLRVNGNKSRRNNKRDGEK